MIAIIKFHQVSPANSFPDLVDRFDHPIGRTGVQRLDLTNFLGYQAIARKLNKLLTYVPNRIGEKMENFVNINYLIK